MQIDQTKIKRWRYLAATCFCCSVLFLVSAIILPIVLMNLIMEQAAAETVMTESSYGLWGQVPGDTNSYLKRDFTFYEFQNPYDVMFRNKTPIFVEAGPFTYQEFQNFTDYQFEEDGNIVSYRCWVRTAGSHTGNVSFANFIALGAWYQMKNTEPPLMALQAFGAFYFEMKKFLFLTMLSQTIKPTFLTEKSAKQTFLKDLPQEQQDLIWFDNQYGMDNQTTFIGWIEASRNGINSGSAAYLKEYFLLSYSEMNTIVKAIVGYIDGATKIITQLYCTDAPSKVCSDEYLCAKQWVAQGITMDTPPGVDPVPSVITGNSSGHGYPEISYFYKEYFLKRIDSSEEYQNIAFTIDWGLKVLKHYANYSITDNQYATEPYVLMHAGNIRKLYEFGMQFDLSNNNEYLEKIKDRFLLDTIYQARVFWEYIKYFEQDFAVQEPINGTKGIASMGTVISQSLYGDMIILEQQLKDTLLIDLLYKEIRNCSYILEQIDDVTDDQKQQFCQIKEFKDWNKDSIKQLIQLCEFQYGPFWEYLAINLNMKDYQLMQICDWDEVGFGKQLGINQKLLKELYQCEQVQCTNYELAIKQWAYSLVSLNPPKKLYKSSYSIHDVYPKIFLHKFEYNWFATEFHDIIDKKDLTYQDIRYLLSFDCLYNGVMVQNAFINYVNNDIQEFKKWLLFDNFNFLHYLRYIMISIGLDGFADNRSIDDALFGYWPTIVDAIKTMNPAMGGDPSTPIAGLNLNIDDQLSQRQAMYTGKNDTSMVRKYSSIDSLPYLNIRLPYFDGNQSTTKQINPWNIEEPCNEGTDALSYAPGQQVGGYIITVIADLIRSLKLDYHSTLDFFGLEAYKYKLDPTMLAINESYNNYRWNGLINFTTVQNAPIMNSLRHFRSGDKALQEMSEIYKDNTLQHRQWDSEWDDSYVIVEPITGVALAALLNLQINVEYKQDILFPCDNYAILPILNLWRGANWTEEQLNITFGDLKLGLKIRIIIIIAGYCGAALFLLLSFIIFYFKVYKPMKQAQIMLYDVDSNSQEDTDDQQKRKEEIQQLIQ